MSNAPKVDMVPITRMLSPVYTLPPTEVKAPRGTLVMLVLILIAGWQWNTGHKRMAVIISAAAIAWWAWMNRRRDE